MQNPNEANNPPDLSKGTPPPPPSNNSHEVPASAPISSPNATPGAAPGGPAANSGRAGQLSLDAISDGWAALSPNLLPWIGAGLLCFLVFLVLGGIQRAILGPQVAAGASPLALRTPTGGMFALQIVSGAFSLLLIGAVYNMALHQLRTGRAEIGQMFNIGDVLGSLVVAGILTTLIQNAGGIVLQILALAGVVLPAALVFLVGGLPSLIAAIALMMVTPLIVDQKVSGIDAIKGSFEAIMPRFGSALVLAILLILINILGACLCGIGMLFTVPLTFLTLAIIYRDLFLGGSMDASPAAPNFPVPPIAHP